MKRSIFVSMILGLCVAAPVLADYDIGTFVAPKGADGTNACPPLISSNTKNAQGCFVIKQKSQVRSNGICQPSGNWSTIDTVCDCRPTETRTPCGHGTEEVCGTAGRAGYKIVTTQCDGTSPTTSYIYDNNCGVTVDSVADVHQNPNDSTTPVVAKRVSFRNTCEPNPLSTTADIPVGEDGDNCQAEVVVTACGPSETVQCDSATKQGVRIQKKDCSGSIVTASTQYIYNGDAGAACNATITTERCGPTLTTKCYENGSESQKAGVKITKTDCSGGNATSAYTYDGEVGTGIYYQGELNDCSALTALKNNSGVTKEPGYAWFVKDLGTGYDAGKLYIWTNNDFPTCPSGGVPFQGPQGAQGEGICDGVANPSVAIKNTVRTYEAPTSSARGYMKLHHTKCNDTTADDQIKDECVPIIAASAATCSNGTYLECTPQGTYTGNSNYAKYNVCEATSGTTIASALGNKEDTLCVGANAQSSSVERKKTIEYTAPSKTNSGDSYYSTVGKMVTKSVKCDNSETPIGYTLDKCEEIAKPNGVCTDTTKVYYKCTQQNDNSTQYNLCASGNSVLGAAQTAAESAAAAAAATVDPCTLVANGDNAAKKAQIKSMSSTYTLQTVSGGNDRTAVGYSTLTKNTCATGSDATVVEYQYDTCKEIVDARTTGACSGNDKVYLECVNQTKGASDSGYTYKVCQTVTANTSLANKIDAAQTTAVNAASAAAAAQTTANGKIDASYLSTNGYLTSSSNLNASKLTGTIDSGRLPSTVVTTGTGGNITTALETEISKTGGVFKDFVTNGDLTTAVSTEVGSQLDTAISEKSVTFGGMSMTLDEALELLGAAAGTCTRSSGGLGSSDGAVSCSGGGLGSVSTTGRN